VLAPSAAFASYAWDLDEAQRLHRALKQAMDDDVALLTARDPAPVPV